jgi:hypothetical protein
LELKDIDLKPEKLNKIYEENGIEFYKVNCNE